MLNKYTPRIPPIAVERVEYDLKEGQDAPTINPRFVIFLGKDSKGVERTVPQLSTEIAGRMRGQIILHKTSIGLCETGHPKVKEQS
jgi:hypothetical protein